MKYQLTFLAIIVIALSGITGVQAQNSMDSSSEVEAVESTMEAFFGAIWEFALMHSTLHEPELDHAKE